MDRFKNNPAWCAALSISGAVFCVISLTLFCITMVFVGTINNLAFDEDKQIQLQVVKSDVYHTTCIRHIWVGKMVVPKFYDCYCSRSEWITNDKTYSCEIDSTEFLKCMLSEYEKHGCQIYMETQKNYSIGEKKMFLENKNIETTDLGNNEVREHHKLYEKDYVYIGIVNMKLVIIICASLSGVFFCLGTVTCLLALIANKYNNTKNKRVHPIQPVGESKIQQVNPI